MTKGNRKKLNDQERDELLKTLKSRFIKNNSWHKNIDWAKVESKLKANPEKLAVLYGMEETGGEPDVVGYNSTKDEYIFMDCSAESPKGRRSFCYDSEALDSRKEHKPENSAISMAKEIGVDILTETQYRALQKLAPFDTKTSSWIETPAGLRKLGGAIFGDYRYGTVFIYHNGAESYYAARGFRGALNV